MLVLGSSRFLKHPLLYHPRDLLNVCSNYFKGAVGKTKEISFESNSLNGTAIHQLLVSETCSDYIFFHLPLYELI